MRHLEKASGKALTEIYGQLFTRLWNTGREEKVVTGRITYARMTPLWMTKPVVFVYGKKQNASTPFNSLKLPTKSEIRGPGNRNLVMALSHRSYDENLRLLRTWHTYFDKTEFNYLH